MYGSNRVLFVQVIVQEVVPVEVFNKIIVDYRLEEFADITKRTNGPMLRHGWELNRILKKGHTVDLGTSDSD